MKEDGTVSLIGISCQICDIWDKHPDISGIGGVPCGGCVFFNDFFNIAKEAGVVNV